MNDYPVGYVYQADLYCPDDMREIAKRGCVQAGVATMWGDCGDAEDILSEWALATGLDREDETTFDSGDFPKVFVGTPHDGCTASEGCAPGQCGGSCCLCHEPLDGQCPNTAVPDDYMAGFIAGYCETMLWASTREIHDADGAESVDPAGWQTSSGMWQIEAFAEKSRVKIREDCESFVSGNWSDLRDLDAGDSGHNFALNRCGHGSGFWDRGLGEAGDRLSAASHLYDDSTAWFDENDPEFTHLDDG